MRKLYRSFISLLVLLIVTVTFTASDIIANKVTTTSASEVKANTATEAKTSLGKAENQPATKTTTDKTATTNKVAETTTVPETAPATNSKVNSPNESKYLMDGTFYPEEYARELGYTIYESVNAEDHFSIVHEDVEYFIIVSWGFCGLCFEKNGNCFFASIYDDITPDVESGYKIATKNTLEGASRHFLISEMNIIASVASSENLENLAALDTPNTTFKMFIYHCSATYFPDGFINPWALETRIPESKIIRFGNSEEEP